MMRKRKIKRKKLNYKHLFILITIVLLFITLITSLYILIFNGINNHKINKKIKEIKEIVTIENIDVDTKDTIEENNINSDLEDIYSKYMKMDLLSVNINELKKINSDTKGWLSVNSTNINYPFVQTADNEYYLNHSFDKSNNKAGWVFLDYRNDINIEQKNTIIYAHGRVNKTMFGSLKDTLKNKWLSNKNNHFVKTSTNNKDSLWQVFSVYKIPTTSDYLQVYFTDNEEFYSFVTKLKNRSIYSFDVNLNNEDRIITLSTCYNSKEKVVLHAKLVKEIQK